MTNGLNWRPHRWLNGTVGEIAETPKGTVTLLEQDGLCHVMYHDRMNSAVYDFFAASSVADAKEAAEVRYAA